MTIGLALSYTIIVAIGFIIDYKKTREDDSR